ncbi:MAG: hypothetical protein V4717_02785 [Bacteroidota bacterium]
MRNTNTIYKVSIHLLLATLSNLISFGQLKELETSKINWITVGEIKWLKNTKASLKYFENNKDTTYLLYLQDDQKLQNTSGMAVTKYFSIRYSEIDNTTGNLYDLLSSFFNDENRKNRKLEKIFTLGNEMIHIQHYPKLSGPAIMFSTKENHIVFTQKELNKLFNR